MSVIYVIECKETGEKYVGSTKTKLYTRMANHRYNCKAYDNGKKISHCSSFNIIRRNNYEVKVLEKLETNDKKEMIKIETKYINDLGSINTKRAYASLEEKKQTMKAYQQTEKYKQNHAIHVKKYHEKNKEELSQKHKEWRDNNKEKIAEQNKAYYQKNKEHVKEYSKAYYENNKKTHEQTKKRLDSI